MQVTADLRVPCTQLPVHALGHQQQLCVAANGWTSPQSKQQLLSIQCQVLPAVPPRQLLQLLLTGTAAAAAAVWTMQWWA